MQIGKHEMEDTNLNNTDRKKYHSGNTKRKTNSEDTDQENTNQNIQLGKYTYEIKARKYTSGKYQSKNTNRIKTYRKYISENTTQIIQIGK